MVLSVSPTSLTESWQEPIKFDGLLIVVIQVWYEINLSSPPFHPQPPFPPPAQVT